MTKRKQRLPFSAASLQSAANALAAQRMRAPAGIGERGEKNLHALFKLAIEPDRSKHEVPLDGYIADVRNEDGVFEIQTRGFARLAAKLEVFLKSCDVTVVCPIVTDKTIVWLDENGEVQSKRQSPKHGVPTDAAAELYALRHLIGHPRLRFLFPRLAAVEYRDAARKNNGAKAAADRLPASFSDVIEVRTRADVKALLPKGLPKTFTAKEFEKHIRRPSRAAHAALGLFCACGFFDRKKEGRAYLYTRKSR